jgi:hypothetical protein
MVKKRMTGATIHRMGGGNHRQQQYPTHQNELPTALMQFRLTSGERHYPLENLLNLPVR